MRVCARLVFPFFLIMPFTQVDSMFAPTPTKRAKVEPRIPVIAEECSDDEGESVNDSGKSTPEPFDAELEAALVAQDAAFIKGSDEAESEDEKSVSSGDGDAYIRELEEGIEGTTKLLAFLQSCLRRVQKPVVHRRRLFLEDD